jgi:hypothetical protein
VPSAKAPAPQPEQVTAHVPAPAPAADTAGEKKPEGRKLFEHFSIRRRFQFF